MKIVDDLIAWLYALKIQEYQSGLEELAAANYDHDKDKCWAFRFRNKSYEPYGKASSIYKPLLAKCLHARAIEIIDPYETLVKGEQHYVRAVLMALVQAGGQHMHHHLPKQFEPQLYLTYFPSSDPLPQHVWENIKVVHAKGLSLINERLLLNDLGL